MNASKARPASSFGWLLKLMMAIGLLFGLVVFALIVGRVTGHLQFFSIPTPGNEPTILSGGHLFASDLLKIERGRFVCYHQTDPRYERAIWVQRAMALAGDTLHIRNGRVFVNGKDADSCLTLNHAYAAPLAMRTRLMHEGVLRDSDFTPPFHNDSIIVQMTGSQAREHGLQHRIRRQELDTMVIAMWGREARTLDDLGPVIVPQDRLFLIGDNRDMSIDSRFIGTVHRSNVIGVVFANF